jgi:hypothetical protein
MGPTDFLPYRTKSCCALGRVEPVNLGSNGKHANHYTTEDDFKDLCLLNKAGSLKVKSKIIAKQAFVPEVEVVHRY